MIKINKVYGRYYNDVLNKYVVICMSYINGQYKYMRLFYQDKKEAEAVQDGLTINY